MDKRTFDELRFSEQFLEPQPMPECVYAAHVVFKQRGYTWEQYREAYGKLTSREMKVSLTYLVGMFPGLTILSSFAQMYAYGMEALERLWETE
jgi:hypothetical protein